MEDFYSDLRLVTNEISIILEDDIRKSYVDISDMNYDHLKSSNYAEALYQLIGHDAQVIREIPNDNMITIKFDNNWVSISYEVLSRTCNNNSIRFHIEILDDPFDHEVRFIQQMKRIINSIKRGMSFGNDIEFIDISNPHYNLSSSNLVLEMFKKTLDISESNFIVNGDRHNFMLTIGEFYVVVSIPYAIIYHDLKVVVTILKDRRDAEYCFQSLD